MENFEGLKDSRTINFLIKLMDNSDSEVRWKAVDSLGLIKNKSTVKFLAKALKDSDFYVRFHAILALREINDPYCIEPLNAFLESEKNPELRKLARDILNHLRKE